MSSETTGTEATAFWHPNLPQGLKPTMRFDKLPGIDPTELLFKRLPLPPSEFGASFDEEARAKFDKTFVLVLWGFVNSDLENVIKLSKDPQAGDLWKLGRDAFTLGNTQDFNNIKNYFFQGLAQLLADYGGSQTLGFTQFDIEEDAPKIRGKVLWVLFCEWVGRGRSDLDGLGVLREQHSDRNELNVIKAWQCCVCDKKIEGKILFCSFCYHPDFKQMNGIRYCDTGCQKYHWHYVHKDHCSRRRFFFRACEMFKRIAHEFEVATFKGTNKTIRSLNIDTLRPPMPEEYEACIDDGTIDPPLRYTVRRNKGVIHFGELAWEHPNIYAILRPLISSTLKGFCEQLSIMTVYVRNVRDIVYLVRDGEVKPGLGGKMQNKNPMFHPHPVLYLRLKGSSEAFILDIHSNTFGWCTDVIPCRVFVRSRLAGVVSVTDALDDSQESWVPEEHQATQRDRHRIMSAFITRCRSHIQEITKSSGGQSSIFQVCNLKDELYTEIRDKIYTFTRETLDGLVEGTLE